MISFVKLKKEWIRIQVINILGDISRTYCKIQIVENIFSCDINISKTVMCLIDLKLISAYNNLKNK